MAIYMEMRFPYIVPWGNLKQSSQVHTFLHSVKASFFKNKFTFLFYTQLTINEIFSNIPQEAFTGFIEGGFTVVRQMNL